MNKLPSVSTRDVTSALQRAGFVIVRQRDHVRLRRGDCLVSIPHYKSTMRYRTLRILLRQAGLSESEFAELLKGR